MHPISRAAIRRSPPWLRRPVALVVRTVDAAMADRLPGLAAEIAFWVLLSLPALLVTAIAAVSVAGDLNNQDWQAQAIDRTIEVSRVALTDRTIEGVVRPVLEQLFTDGGVGIISFAFLTAIWTASRAVKVILSTTAIVYRRAERRRGWQDRLLGFGVTIGALLVGMVIAPLLIAGPNFGTQLDEWTDQDLGVLVGIWEAAYWPTVIVVATLALAALYHLGVPGRTPWKRDLPGAIVATAVWLAGSGALRLYGAWIAGGESPYGPLAGPIVVLFWMWLTGFAVLLGAEINAQLAHVWSVPSSELANGDLDEHRDDHDDEPRDEAVEAPPDAATADTIEVPTGIPRTEDRRTLRGSSVRPPARRN